MANTKAKKPAPSAEKTPKVGKTRNESTSADYPVGLDRAPKVVTKKSPSKIIGSGTSVLDYKGTAGG